MQADNQILQRFPKYKQPRRSIAPAGLFFLINNWRSFSVSILEEVIDPLHIQRLPPGTANPLGDLPMLRMIFILQNFHNMGKSLRTAAILHRSIPHRQNTVRISLPAILNHTAEFHRMEPSISKVIFIKDFCSG